MFLEDTSGKTTHLLHTFTRFTYFNHMLLLPNLLVTAIPAYILLSCVARCFVGCCGPCGFHGAVSSIERFVGHVCAVCMLQYGQNAASLFNSNQGFNVVVDVVLLALPLPIVWQLNCTWREQISLSAIVFLGGLYATPLLLTRWSRTDAFMLALHSQAYTA